MLCTTNSSPIAATRSKLGILWAASWYTRPIDEFEYTPTSASRPMCGPSQDERQKSPAWPAWAQWSAAPPFADASCCSRWISCSNRIGFRQFWISAQTSAASALRRGVLQREDSGDEPRKSSSCECVRACVHACACVRVYFCVRVWQVCARVWARGGACARTCVCVCVCACAFRSTSAGDANAQLPSAPRLAKAQTASPRRSRAPQAPNSL